MMGSNDKPQEELFYAFNLDEIVPQDHLLRDIDRVLDLSKLREHLAPYYSHTGRPSIDPELMIRMLLNLAYRWFCKLSITDTVPDHSTFSKNRHGRFRESEAFRFVFEQVLQRCMDEGLIGAEGFAVDASVVKADASTQKHHDDDDDWGSGSRAIKEYLDALVEDGSSSTPAKRISQTDPQARWTYRGRDHRRCRGYAGASHPGGLVDEDHDRAGPRALRRGDEEADRRYRLRYGRVPGLDGERGEHRAACPGLGPGRRVRGPLRSLGL
jgi:transposase